ncbi:GerMN domain-containing protein [Paenibacillus glycanilyticus]|uniref:GerMN domain-containing protein n=1 Tax=Paenibacillus glycanilyticus TaxID=126569 RepID=A0ABQ6GD78_9BACL|nr:GerMN domain-containing protein [Paenibacillus glycanilyticus]GLX68904.1 hypothetical protein MU1_32490 [Paenibacillus glycanilyticus]
MRKPAIILLVFIVLLTAAACGNSNKPGGQSDSGNEAANTNTADNANTSADEPSPSPSEEPAATKEPDKETDSKVIGSSSKPVNPIKIYYADTELEKLVEQDRNVTFDSDEELVKEALNALQKDGPDGTVSLWKPIPIKSVKLADNAVTIDIELPDEARLGAPGEQMLLDSLGQTLFQFEFVQSYDLLVDGQAPESLMGHFDLDHPTVRPTVK